MTTNNIPTRNNSTVPDLSVLRILPTTSANRPEWIDRLSQNVLLKNNYSGSDLNVRIPPPPQSPLTFIQKYIIGYLIMLRRLMTVATTESIVCEPSNDLYLNV